MSIKDEQQPQITVEFIISKTHKTGRTGMVEATEGKLELARDSGIYSKTRKTGMTVEFTITDTS